MICPMLYECPTVCHVSVCVDKGVLARMISTLRRIRRKSFTMVINLFICTSHEF